MFLIFPSLITEMEANWRNKRRFPE